MATKISVFNTALSYMGLTRLSSPEEDIESARELRAHFNAAVDLCFEAGAWNFAAVRAQLARVLPAPAFGYRYYYQLPADWQRLVFVSETGEERDPLLAYEEEQGKIATSAETVYIKYVTNTKRFEVGGWSQHFADYVAADLADRVCLKLAPDAVQRVAEKLKKNKSQALNIDAVVQPPQMRRPGRWVMSNRRGSSWSKEQGR